MQAAINHCQLFKLVDTGGFSYEQLGVKTIDGMLPKRIVEEHLFIKGVYHQAVENKETL